MEYLQKMLRESIENELEFRCFKHDIYNHVFVIKTYIEMGMVEEGLQYIDKLVKYTDDFDFRDITGNTEIDIILRSKIAKLESIGVEMDILAKLPERINMDIFDITVMLGNLLDNAFEALIFAKEKRLQLDINIVDNSLYINIANTHSNQIIKVGNLIKSSKKSEIRKHGLGLRSVKCSVLKYKGEMDISYDESEFNVDIAIPLENAICC